MRRQTTWWLRIIVVLVIASSNSVTRNVNLRGNNRGHRPEFELDIGIQIISGCVLYVRWYDSTSHIRFDAIELSPEHYADIGYTIYYYARCILCRCNNSIMLKHCKHRLHCNTRHTATTDYTRYNVMENRNFVYKVHNPRPTYNTNPVI